MMLPSLKCVEHFGHKVVDVEQFELHCPVVDGYRQIICNIIAEGSHGGIIIRSAPFAKQVWETVNQHLRSCFLAVRKDKLLARLFASAVVRVIATDAGCLNG